MSSPHLRCTLSQLIAILTSRQRTLAVLGLALLSTISGCRSTPSWMNSKISSEPIELSISQIDPASGGSYTVSGSTTLPNKTQVTVYAVRNFTETPDNGANPALNSTIPNTTISDFAIPNYAILDRQPAEVNQGTWQTRLSLGKSLNGRVLEPWQNNSAAIRRNPESTVTFLAVLEPAHQPRNLQRRIESEDSSTQSSIVRYTTDGELYLQAGKTLTVPAPQVNLPTAATPIEPPPVRVKVIGPESGSPESQALQQPRTDVPLAVNALFR